MRIWKNYSSDLLLENLKKQNWNLANEDVQGIANEIEQKVMTTLEDIIPFKEKRILHSFKVENEEILELSKKKKNLFTNYKRRKSANLLERCKKLDKEISCKLKKIKKTQVRNTIVPGNPKSLWDAVKILKGNGSTNIQSEMKLNGHCIRDCEIPDKFKQFFENKITSITNNIKIDGNVYNGERKLNMNLMAPITSEKVKECMRNLKKKKCFGYDRIPLIVLVDGAEVLAEPYARLLQEIQKTNIIPEQWKTARIIPLWKKGDKSEISNYRPISNLCAASKIWEKLIQEHVVNESNRTRVDLTGKEQHGFKKNRSTATAQLEIQSKLATAMDNNDYIAMASLDLSAAFDVVNVVLLMTRLKIMGFSYDLLAQLNFWLTDRSFFVEANDKNSVFGSSTQGTIQGSILGPMLFGLFISPLYKIVDIITNADDNYILGRGKSKDEALENLGEKLEKTMMWLTNSGLKINKEKT